MPFRDEVVQIDLLPINHRLWIVCSSSYCIVYEAGALTLSCDVNFLHTSGFPSPLTLCIALNCHAAQLLNSNEIKLNSWRDWILAIILESCYMIMKTYTQYLASPFIILQTISLVSSLSHALTENLSSSSTQEINMIARSSWMISGNQLLKWVSYGYVYAIGLG